MPRRTSTLEHLRAVTRDVQLRLAETLTASGDTGLGPSFAPFLGRVRDGALPIGRIASELGSSPQAASRTARALEELGYVARTTSTTDGRAKLVALTARGHALLERAHGTFTACERSYALLVGRARVERILRDLEVLHFGLGLTPETGPVVHAPAPRSIGTCVLVTLHATRQEQQALSAHGHSALRRSHQELLRTVGSRGGRVSEAARTLRISRQAVSAMVQDLEQLGYLRRRPDAIDRRAVVVSPTGRGMSALRAMDAAARRLEEDARAVLGTARWARLERDLAGLDEALAVTAVSAERGPRPDLGVTGQAPSLDLRRLAVWLRKRLGAADAAQLAALLAEPSAVPGGG